MIYTIKAVLDDDTERVLGEFGEASQEFLHYPDGIFVEESGVPTWYPLHRIKKIYAVALDA